MHFCSECQNMYYISIDSENTNKLVYYCRNCGHEDSTLTINNISVSKTQVTSSDQKFLHIINKYTKLDPTLPRINKIKCPFADCESNKSDSVEREIIYIRYDDVNMKYVYLCTICDAVWKSDEQK